MDEQAATQQRLKSAIDSNERYRTRARAIAALCAAAAGALATGLVMAPSQNMTLTAQVFGLASIVFLVISTGLCVAASATSSYPDNQKGFSGFGKRIALWRVGAATNDEQPTVGDAQRQLDNSSSILKRINHLIDLALWVAAAASATLIIALFLIVFSPGDDRRVEIHLSGRINIDNCPNIVDSVKGNASLGDVASNSKHIPVRVAKKYCETDGPATVYINRSLIKAIETEP